MPVGIRFRYGVFSLLVLLVCCCSPSHAAGHEEKKVGKDTAVSPGAAVIGDPREIFLTRKKKTGKNHSETSGHKIHREINSLDDFFVYLQEDISKAGEELKQVQKKLKEQQKHIFHDPDFVQPKRPDWR